MQYCRVACGAVLGLLWLASPAQAATLNPANNSLAFERIAFTKNVGQWPDSILFRASTGGTTMWFTQDGIYYQFIKSIPRPHSGEEALAAGLGPRAIDPAGRWQAPDSIETALVKASFVGANPKAEAVGLEEFAYKCNYFLGNAPSKWYTDVPTYAGVGFKDIYPGVDATFRGKNGKLEYVLSGSVEAIQKIKTAYSGAAAASQADGSTVLATPLGEKRFHGIVPASATDATPRTINTASLAGGVTLVYSTYLGGNLEDRGSSIAVDASGSAYVTGFTYSANYPTQDSYQLDPDGEATTDVFVTKLSPDGNSLVYSTYLGGSASDQGISIAVDDAGNAYLTGSTASTDFPTQTPYQMNPGEDTADVFVTKLSSAGSSLVYSTYLGGSNLDAGLGIAVDSAGSTYVTGRTRSTDFPTQFPYQTDPGDNTYDAFVSKLSASGSSLVYSTYLGGNSSDGGAAVAVDRSGYAYVIGSTLSSDFPTKAPYQTDPSDGVYDVFVTKLTPAGDDLVYSTYLGGNSDDMGYDIALDGSGNAYVTGSTASTDFPTQTPRQSDQPSYDAFVTKLAPGGNSLVYSTYLGGSSIELGCGIALGDSGSVYVTGRTYSTDFPSQKPFQAYQFDDAFVTRLSPDGSSLIYSTCLGGSSSEVGNSIAVDRSGSAYVTGFTISADFPTEVPYQSGLATGTNGTSDAFVTKLSPGPCCAGTTGNVNETGIVDLSDLSLLISYLTLTPQPVLPCPDEANVNAIGIIDLVDLSLLIAYLTVMPRPALPNCL